MKTLILLAFFIAFIAISTCDPHRRTQRQEEPPKPDDPTEEQTAVFKEWKEKFGKEYSSEEEENEAMKKVLKNYGRIEEHNRKFEDGEVGFTRGLFAHSDMSSQEKRKFLTGLAVPPSEKVEHTPRSLPALPQFPHGPESVNWVEKGLVGPVVDQGWCNSCWAFSAAGIVDAVMRKKNIVVEVAPQQLVDCSTKFCWGCQSGWPKYALDYVKTNGISLDDTYPYLGEKDDCTYTKDKAVGFVNATYNIPTRGNETWLRDIVASVGPVSIVMCLQESFYNYESGVYNQENCCKDIVHAMIIVGYGTDPVGGDYWLVKNTWGDSWGENGYIRVARNRNNMCNIAHYAVYAT